MDALLGAALAMADASGPILRRYFRSELLIETKDDSTPVSAADREVEAAIRAIIAERFPDHGIIGEEYGNTNADAHHVWVLDPLDGTASFVTGKPVWGTLIALADQGKPVLGVIDQPVLAERWVGAAGRPTTLNGKPARVRACEGLERAWTYATTPAMFQGANLDAWTRLTGRVRQTVYGADCYAYGLLASGFVDLVVEARLKPYDYCALVPVIEGAGGVVTDWQGRPLTTRSDGRVVAAGDARVHRAALEALKG
ncbi:MAG: histidinol-phosphatase [Proteobacteria bacterium]|nr:histidinol-phosphatase [Pseudomonadota bacterium]